MKASIASWGPAGWTFLHTISFVYPYNPTLKDKQVMVDYLYAFTAVIPCQRCRTDFTFMLHTIFGDTKEEAMKSKHLENRETLSKILVDMHNRVNERLNKKILSYDAVVEMYTKTPKNTHILVVISLLSFVVVYLLACLIACRIKKK